MKRFELMNDKKTAWDVVRPICDGFADAGDYVCEKCPFAEMCSQGSNGVMNWLMEEVEE